MEADVMATEKGLSQRGGCMVQLMNDDQGVKLSCTLVV